MSAGLCGTPEELIRILIGGTTGVLGAEPGGIGSVVCVPLGGILTPLFHKFPRRIDDRWSRVSCSSAGVAAYRSGAAPPDPSDMAWPDEA